MCSNTDFFLSTNGKNKFESPASTARNFAAFKFNIRHRNLNFFTSEIFTYLENFG